MSDTHVIVGAGQAGSWAAVAMRQAGFAGKIVLVGEEALHPYERPPLSKAALIDEVGPSPQYFHPQQKYAELDIELLFERKVEGIDTAKRRISLGEGRWLDFDRLMIATGGRARTLPSTGTRQLLHLRTIQDAEGIREMLRSSSNILCIGAGVIGLEVASSARALGKSVTVLEMGTIPMGRSVSPEIGAFVGDLHRNAGVDLRLGVKIQAIEPLADGRIHVGLGDSTSETFDGGIVAIGMSRNDALAREAGIATDNGILVDEFGRSSVPDIYAAGDVAAFLHPLYGRHLRLESWKHAQNHGIAVARAMCGQPVPYADVPWFWTDQHGVNLQVAGFPAEATHTVFRRESDPLKFTALHLGEDDRLVGASSAGNPRDMRAAQSLIASQAKVDPAKAVDPSVPLQKIGST